MRKINFTKMVASGNDFIVIENHPPSTVHRPRLLAKEICDRKFGVGADGMLILEKSKKADIKMRIFNADGSEAQMCGNGARCVALYKSTEYRVQSTELKIETKAGIIETKLQGDLVKIKLTDPKDLKLNIPIKVNSRLLRVNFINTGVPHAVIFSESLDKIDVFNLGRAIRFHQKFSPAGANVDFVEISGRNSLAIRTYERGVEDETLACGTGSVAAALVASYQLSHACRQAGAVSCQQFNVHTKSKERLKVYFDKINNGFKNVWLEGRAKIVYKGEYYSNEGRTYGAKRT
jgi:diaminopimelate epimerase